MLVALPVPGWMPRKPTESLISARSGQGTWLRSGRINGQRRPAARLLSRPPAPPAKSPKDCAERLSLCRHVEEYGPASGRRRRRVQPARHGPPDAELRELPLPTKKATAKKTTKKAAGQEGGREEDDRSEA